MDLFNLLDQWDLELKEQQKTCPSEKLAHNQGHISQCCEESEIKIGVTHNDIERNSKD